MHLQGICTNINLKIRKICVNTFYNKTNKNQKITAGFLANFPRLQLLYALVYNGGMITLFQGLARGNLIKVAKSYAQYQPIK